MPIITSAGVTPITTEAYIEELNTRFRRALGQDLNLDVETPQGQLIGIIAALASSLDDAIVHVASGQDLNRAIGRQLDVIGRPFGIVRLAATNTTATVTITGTSGTSVPADTVLSTSGGIDFTTDDLVTIGTDGTVEVDIQSFDVGPITLADNASLTSPLALSIDSVEVNDGSVSVGEATETDDKYRTRIRLTIAVNAVGSIDAIRSNLLALRTVDEAKLYENDDDEAKNIDEVLGLAGAVVGERVTLAGLYGTLIFELNGTSITTVATGGSADAAAVAEAIQTAINANDNFSGVSVDAVTTGSRDGLTLSASMPAFDIELVSTSVSLGSSNDEGDIFGDNPFVSSSMNPNTLVIVVDSQDVTNVGNMIILTKPPGVTTKGDITYRGNTVLGFGVTVSYYEAQEVTSEITVNLRPRAGFPFGGETLIKDTITKYVNSLKIGESINRSQLIFTILSVGNLDLGTISAEGNAPGAIHGDEVNISSLNSISDPTFTLNGDDFTVTVDSGDSGSDIASIMQAIINAHDDYNGVVVTYRGTATSSYFDVRGLPEKRIVLGGTNAGDFFGGSPGVVDGVADIEVIDTTMRFNQKIVTSNASITIGTN